MFVKASVESYNDFDIGFIFFFNDTATTEIYTLSLHDALPIWCNLKSTEFAPRALGVNCLYVREIGRAHRLNSSHANISYAVFCLKKQKKHTKENNRVNACITSVVRLHHMLLS